MENKGLIGMRFKDVKSVVGRTYEVLYTYGIKSENHLCYDTLDRSFMVISSEEMAYYYKIILPK